jgi:heme exporter protein CcmD
MFDWLQNPHADYVVAAYAVALALLVALGLLSWWAARHMNKKWQKLLDRRP